MNALNLIDYLRRWKNINEQCSLAMWAMDNFSDDNYSMQEYLKLNTQSEESKRKIDEGHLDKNLEKLTDDIDRTYNGVRQNTIILHLASFENFTKEIHRKLLNLNNKWLKGEKIIPIEKLVNQGYESVISECIEKEVHGLDRKTIKERSNLFKRFIGIGFEDDSIKIDDLKNISDLRNKILHGDPHLEVLDTQVEKTSNVCLMISINLFTHSKERCPEGFVIN